MADLRSGVAKFAAALGGRNAIRQEAESDARKDLRQIALGEIAADEFRNRQGLGGALSNLGIERGDDLATVLRGGFANFEQGTGGLRDLADLALQRDAVAIAKDPNPDVAVLNRLLASRNTGGGPLSPQQASVVPLGAALVESAQAQAGQRQALADAARARVGATGSQAAALDALADLRRRTNPNLRVTKPGAVLQTGPAPTLAEELGSVADIGPESETFVVTDQTGPQGARLSDLQHQQREQEGLQALNDARRAVQSGRISKEAARKRLYDAGYQNLAGRL